MSANDKVAATTHGGEFTPDTATIRTFYTSDTDGYPIPGRAAQFNRWLETVRAEAKAEALREAADQTPVHWDFPPHASALQIRPWLRDRANQYKEELANGR
ncbi:hypothetical protein ACIOJF_03690 [Glutamicibacter sp. NPDC087831]|uniref:hypothetical protein n=1 Tax=Glutamicibacter sp. NPDC087831 TaxID=3363998 RepID=UPI0038187D81